jgi:hypothetical protein
MAQSEPQPGALRFLRLSMKENLANGDMGEIYGYPWQEAFLEETEEEEEEEKEDEDKDEEEEEEEEELYAEAEEEDEEEDPRYAVAAELETQLQLSPNSVVRLLREGMHPAEIELQLSIRRGSLRELYYEQDDAEEEEEEERVEQGAPKRARTMVASF